MTRTEIFFSNNQHAGGGGHNPASRNYPSFSQDKTTSTREEGAYYQPRPPIRITPTRPNPKKIAMAVAPIMRHAPTDRIKALDEIVRMAGKKPDAWKKPCFGDFEYWLAHNCGWISDEELKADTAAHEAKKQLALETSHRFSKNRYSWDETPRFEDPVDSGAYTPQVNMKLIHDRNLTDSARRISMFVMRHTYQDNRSGRYIGMTVSFIMKGLALSRRTVQRSLTLLETRGYFRCEVAHNTKTKMCVGLIIRLLSPIFPGHHKDKWPKKRENPEASNLPLKKGQVYKSIYTAKKKVLRITWALKCMNGVARTGNKTDPTLISSVVPECRGFKTLGAGMFLHPKIRTTTEHKGLQMA